MANKKNNNSRSVSKSNSKSNKNLKNYKRSGTFMTAFKGYFGFMAGAIVYFLFVLLMIGGAVGGYFLAKSGGAFSDEKDNNNNNNNNNNGNGNENSNTNTNNNNDESSKKNTGKIVGGYILMCVCGLIAFILLLPSIIDGIGRMIGYMIAGSIYDSFD